MKRLIVFVAPVALLLPGMATAQSAFDGTWKIDINKAAFDKKPDVFILKDGMYSCKTCVPAYTVKADGSDQPVAGHPYFDSVAIKVVSDHEIQETDKKGGKTVATSTSKVSADGNTTMFSFVDSSNTNGGPPVTGKGEAVRVAPGPAGSSALSGSWQMKKIEGLSDNGTTTKYMVMGNEFMMSSPTGQSYTAKLDGTEAPMKGDPGVTSVMVKMPGKNMLEETDKRDGKVIGVFKMTIEADGKTAKATYDDLLMHRTTAFVMLKQ